VQGQYHWIADYGGDANKLGDVERLQRDR